ncbi:MAG: hypothetical protein IPL62_15810 [Caulobacteraceae bacterium]|nr:hypothetical protein [Caulobacteraceae bacterium]
MALRMAALALSALGALAMTEAAQAQTPANAGDIIVDTRLRYASVSQDGLADADALTLRAWVTKHPPGADFGS